MTLAEEYARQSVWRTVDRVIDTLPARGRTILDVGCGIGDVAAELTRRGAQVIGVDADRALLDALRARHGSTIQIIEADLRDPLPPIEFDDVWCSFTSAYFPDLSTALERWTRRMRPGGWLALIEVDDLFGHEPLAAKTRQILEAYANDAQANGRYDFFMGRKLARHVSAAGFRVSQELALDDAELAFQGAAGADVMEAWRARFERMTHLKSFAADDFASTRDDFLSCIAHRDHVSQARVLCCVGHKV